MALNFLDPFFRPSSGGAGARNIPPLVKMPFEDDFILPPTEDGGGGTGVDLGGPGSGPAPPPREIIPFPGERFDLPWIEDYSVEQPKPPPLGADRRFPTKGPKKDRGIEDPRFEIPIYEGAERGGEQEGDFEQSDFAQFGISQDTIDLLRQISEEGAGREFGRAQFTLQGEPIASNVNLAKRQVGEQAFLSGASASGFAIDPMRQLEMQKQNALQRLRFGIESQNQNIASQARQQLLAAEAFNRHLQRTMENRQALEAMGFLERHAEERRINVVDQAQNPSAGSQIFDFFTGLLPPFFSAAFEGFFQNVSPDSGGGESGGG